MARRYAVIYADPPWRHSSKHHGYGGADDHYPTMALEGIKAIRVPAADDCALFLEVCLPGRGDDRARCRIAFTQS